MESGDLSGSLEINGRHGFGKRFKNRPKQTDLSFNIGLARLPGLPGPTEVKIVPTKNPQIFLSWFLSPFFSVLLPLV